MTATIQTASVGTTTGNADTADTSGAAFTARTMEARTRVRNAEKFPHQLRRTITGTEAR